MMWIVPDSRLEGWGHVRHHGSCWLMNRKISVFKNCAWIRVPD